MKSASFLCLLAVCGCCCCCCCRRRSALLHCPGCALVLLLLQLLGLSASRSCDDSDNGNQQSREKEREREREREMRDEVRLAWNFTISRALAILATGDSRPPAPDAGVCLRLAVKGRGKPADQSRAGLLSPGHVVCRRQTRADDISWRKGQQSPQRLADELIARRRS